MGVDASAIGGVGTGNAIPGGFDYYHDRGFFTADDEEKFDDIDCVGELIKDIVGECVSFTYTYGYDESELYANVAGENIDEIYANIDGYISGLAKIGIKVDREDIGPYVISFFS